MSSNFFETLKSDNKRSGNDAISSMQLKSSSTSRLIETDSAVTSVYSQSDRSSNADSETSMVSSSNSVLPPSTEAETRSSFGGGNFFANPEIKLKLKKADGIPIITDFLEEVAKTLPNRWKEFGTEIGIENGVLETIEQRNSARDSNDPHCFAEVFNEWEKSKGSCRPCTWLTIVSILKYSLQEFSIADDIERKFLNQQEIPDHLHFESDYSSLPSSINQTIQSSGLSLPDSINQPSHQSGSTSPLSSLSDTVSSHRQGTTPKMNRPIIGNVLPSPDFPFDGGNLTISSSTNHNEMLFGNQQLTGNSTPMWASSINNGIAPLYSLPAQQGNVYHSSSGISGSNQIPRGGGLMQQPLPSYYSPNLFNTNLLQYGNEQEIGIHSSTSNYDQHQRNISPTLNHSTDQSYNQTQFQQRPQFSQGPQFPQGSQFQQGSHFPQGLQFQQGSQFSPGSQFQQQGLRSQFTQGSQFPQGSQFQQGLYPSQGAPFSHGSVDSSFYQASQFSQMPSHSPHGTQFSQGTVSSMPSQGTQGTQFSQGTVTSTPVSFSHGTQFLQGASFSQGLQSPQIMYQQPLPDNTVFSSKGLSITAKQQLHSSAVLDSHEEETSNSSYHSAITSLKKHDEVSFNELLQKYMKELENRQDKKRHTPNKTNTKFVQRRPKAEEEERESLTQKELDKAYERISSLEVRIQDLTMQSSIEIPEDHEVSYMQEEKLQQEYLRMREMKRQAEKQTMEAKQTTQRLVAENSRLKEELALVKNDREMIVNQLKRDIKSSKEREVHSKQEQNIASEDLKEKIAKRYKMIESAGLSRKEHLIQVSEMPPMTVSLQLFSKILSTQKGKLSLGHVVIAGLPACGKTTILKSLLQNENPGKPLKGRGEETCLEVHEILITSNPLTEETKWSSAPGLESAVYLFAAIVTQHCLRNKCRPCFPPLDNLEKEVKSIPFLQDKEVQQHFIRVYKAIKVLIEDKAKINGLSELALFQPSFINIWDVGVNRALYDFLACGATQCERLVMVLFIDLERDVPQLDVPPDMAGKKSYMQRGDDKLVMKIHSRLRYLLVLAGIKRLYSSGSPTINAPEAIIIGLHTKEYASLNGGKKLQETVDLLQRAILVEADKMKIGNVIVPKIPTFCTNANNESNELNKLKLIIEELVRSQADYNTVFEANNMFLRSLLYGEDKPMMVSRRTISKLASKCGIHLQDQLNDFLTNCRDTGSLLFYPKSTDHFLYENITLDVVKPLKLLDRLYYLPTYSETRAINPIGTEDMEQYSYGIVSKKLLSKLFVEEDIDLFLRYLLSSYLCANISLSGQEEKYFFPSLRSASDMSKPQSHSLFIKHSSGFLNSACLTLYVNFLKEFFQVPSEALISHTKQYNTVLFKIYKTPSSKPTDVLVISHLKRSLVEIRISDLENSIDLDLCSRFVQLSHLVFEHLSNHLQFLTFELCVNCPENKCHFAPFFLRYHQNEVYCKDCEKSVPVTDNRLCWLS